MIKLVNLTKTFNDKSGVVKILDNINLELPSTGFISLCGKSGCGKTTLLKMLDGQLNEYQGEILYDGINVKELSILKRDEFYSENVFYLKYNSNFFLKLSVKQAIDFYLNKKEKERMNQLIEKYELKDLLKKKIKQLSSGELQKISLSIAISKQAKITLLDEPICNMDNKSMNGFIDEIVNLSKKSLVIYVSHFEKDIENKYDVKLRMYNGKITIEKGIEIKQDTIESNNISNHFNFKRALLCEYVKPNSFYLLFRCVLLLIIIFSMYVSKLNSVTYSDVYKKLADSMSVNILSIPKDSNIENDAIVDKLMYKAPEDNLGEMRIYPELTGNVQMPGFGKASDYRFDGFNQKLNKGEVIISDYFANVLKLVAGDQITFDQRITIDIDQKEFQKVDYTIKYIYKTNYQAYAYLNKIDKIPDYEKYVYFSDEDVNQIAELSLNGFGGIRLDGVNVIKWKDEYSQSKYMANNLNNEYLYLDNLEEDEFYADICALSGLNLSYLVDGWEFGRYNGNDEEANVIFTYNGKSISKKLKFKGLCGLINGTLISEKVYQEVIDTFGINIENVLDNNSFSVKTLDFENKNYKSVFDNLKNYNDIEFANDLIISQAYSKTATTKSLVNSNSLYFYLFCVIFIVISLYEIIRIEYHTYIYLKEKNYNLGNSIALISVSKLFVWLIVGAVLISMNYILSIIVI